MKLRTQIVLNNTVLTGLLLLAGAMGLHVHSAMTGTQDLLVGPARETQQNVATTGSAIRDQMLALEMVLAGIDAERGRLDAAGGRADAALAGIAAAGLLSRDALEPVVRLHASYDQTLTAVLTAHATATAGKRALDEHTVDFDELSSLLEEIGDDEIEKLAGEPDRKLSWGDGLGRIWETADGGMENRIALLAQFLALGRVEAGRDREASAAEIRAALAEQRETASRMLSTDTFERAAPPRWGSGTLADVYTREFAVHERLITDYTDALLALPDLRAAYIDAAESLRGAVERLQQTAAEVIEAATTESESSAACCALAAAGAAPSLPRPVWTSAMREARRAATVGRLRPAGGSALCRGGG